MVKTRQIQRNVTIAAIVCVACFPRIAQSQSDSRDIKRESLINELVASKLFVSFPLSSFNIRAKPTTYYCEYPGESYEHLQGVFGSRSINFSARGEDTAMNGFTLNSDMDYRVLNDDIQFLSQDECLEKAKAVRELLWPQPEFQSGVAAKPVIRDYKNSVNVVWNFYEPAQMLIRIVSLSIRKVDGKCTYIAGGQAKWRSGGRKSGLAASYTEAMESATELLKSEPKNADAILKSWTIDSSRGDFYVFQYELPRADDLERKNISLTIFVNANNGKAQLQAPTHSESEMVKADQHLETQNRTPYWTRRGLVFISNNFRQSFDDKSVGTKIILREATGKYSVVYNVFNSNIRILFSAPWSDWLVFADRGSTYAVNVNDGQVKSIGTPNRPCYWVSVLEPDVNKAVSKSPAAKKDLVLPFETTAPIAAVIAAVGSEGRNRLFLDKLDRPFPLVVRQRMDWKELSIPHFSPNGNTVFLCYTGIDPKTKKSGTSIRSMSIKRFLASEGKPDFDALAESSLVHFTFRNIKELHLYDEANQLFIATGDFAAPALVIDIKTHKETLVTRKKILQNNASQLSSINEIFPGQKSGQLTIAASTKKNQNQLFLCNIDGTNLIQLTSEKEMLVKYHQFLSKKTGFDISKEIALDQLAWERKERD